MRAYACISQIDALHQLQAERCTHALVLEPSSGQPVCLLDVLQLVQASVAHAERSIDAQQLHALWGATVALDRHSQVNGSEGGGEGGGEDASWADDGGSVLGSPVRFDREEGEVDKLIRPEDSISMVGGGADTASMIGGGDARHDALTARPPLAPINGRGAWAASGTRDGDARHGAQCDRPTENGVGAAGGALLVKLQDAGGQYHRVHCAPESGWVPLRAALQAKLSKGGEPLRAIVYTDADGDRIVVDSDEGLCEAAQHAWRGGKDRLLVTALYGEMALLSPTAKTVIGAAEAPAEARGALGGGAAPPRPAYRKSLSPRLGAAPADPRMSAVTAFLGGLVAASSVAVGAGLMIAVKAAKR